jgi:hypothetical protein
LCAEKDELNFEAFGERKRDVDWQSFQTFFEVQIYKSRT